MYGSIAAWRTYAADRGDTAPTDASDADATAALIRASDYIKFSYVERFVKPYDYTVAEVEPATYEAAFIELTTPGFFKTTFTEAQRKVLTGVGSVKWTILPSKSTARSASLAAPTSTIVDSMLGKYMPNDVGYSPWFKSIGGQVVS